jgi:hypothetical protein
MKPTTIISLLLLAVVTATSNAQDLVWTVGLPGDGWPQDLGTGGGPETVFVQETGSNELPGNPENAVADQQSDDDYYFAGVYSTVLDGGTYDPVGVVVENEIGAERALTAGDTSLRYHFNFPDSFDIALPLVVQWDVNNLDQRAENPDPRYGVEVFFNGNQIAEETLIRPADFGVINETPPFAIEDVNAMIGEGFDNYVELRGVPYNNEGGGAWMGIDHVSLHQLSGELADPGDFNADGVIDVADFTILASNIYGHLDGVSGFNNGDMNRDGRIDMADFHDFVGVFPTAAAAANAVPEPSCMMLASFLMLLLGITRSRRVRAA